MLARRRWWWADYRPGLPEEGCPPSLPHRLTLLMLTGLFPDGGTASYRPGQRRIFHSRRSGVSRVTVASSGGWRGRAADLGAITPWRVDGWVVSVDVRLRVLRISVVPDCPSMSGISGMSGLSRMLVRWVRLRYRRVLPSGGELGGVLCKELCTS